MKSADVLSSALSSPRPGRAAAGPAIDAGQVVTGLELSDIEYRPISFFKENPVNDIFRSMKSAKYMADLAKDIADAGIVNPLVAMPDGLLLEGESRLLVARQLGLKRLPVRLVASPLSDAEQEKRLLLGNLMRFEIGEDARLLLLARAGFYSDTVTRAETAEKTGKSVRQVIRDAQIVEAAEEIAEAQGKAAPTVEDVQAAREQKNEVRRVTSKDNVRILLEPILEEMLAEEEYIAGWYARKIKEVMGW